jgi:hypothetical protein
MTQKKCAKCGQFYEDSMSQKLERKSIQQALGLINLAGLDQAKTETQNYCYDCWKGRFRSLIKPFAQQLGKSVEGW